MFITFAALAALCLFVGARTSLPSGAAPLAVLCATMLWYSLMGCFDLLFPAGLLWFAAALAAAAALALRRKEIRWKELFGPGMVFFLIAGLVVIGLFALRQPTFMEWDEFTFWGIAPKVVKSTGRLYTLEPGSMVGVTYVPGLVMLDQAFQFLGAAFVPWKVFAAYDLLYFAVFAAALSMFRRRGWRMAVPMAVVLTLLPYLLTVYYRGIYVQPIYMSSYADIPMGLLFGAGLALYFAAEKKTPAVLTAAALAVTAESVAKDMGFALCLVAAALICFDLLFVERGEVTFARLRGVWAKLCWCALTVLAPLGAFFGWALHMQAALGLSRFDLGGSEEMGMVEMVATGLVELVSPQKSEKFAQIADGMYKAFFTTKLSMFGSGLTVVLVILALLALAYLCGDRIQKARAAWFAALSTLGFAAFYIFNIFTYAYIFKGQEALGLSNYNRYIYPYYIGWMLAALALLGKSLADGRAQRAGGRVLLWQGALFAAPYALMAAVLLPLRGAWAAQDGASYRLQPLLLAAGLGLTALLLGLSAAPLRTAPFVPLLLAAFSFFCCARVYALVQPQLSVVDYPDGYFAGRNEQIAQVERLKARLGEEERVFYICTGDDGRRWFMSYYDFYPDVLLDYSLGGAGISPESRLNTVSIPRFFTRQQAARFLAEGVTLTPEIWCEYLEASGCTAVYLERVDESFQQAYGALFEGGAESGGLYRVQGDAQNMRFLPIPEEVSAR